MTKQNSGKWAIGALIAGVAGYLTGILTAPKSGKETRKDIHDSAVKAKTEAEKRLKELHKELSDLVDKGKKHASKFSAKAQTEYSAAVEKAQSAKQRASELLSAVHEGEADDKELQKAIEEAKKASEHLKAFLASYDKKTTKE